MLSNFLKQHFSYFVIFFTYISIVSIGNIISILSILSKNINLFYVFPDLCQIPLHTIFVLCVDNCY